MTTTEETRAADGWIRGDGMYEVWRYETLLVWERSAGGLGTLDQTQLSVIRLAALMRSWYETELRSGSPVGLGRDLGMAALGRVDWEVLADRAVRAAVNKELLEEM